MLPRNSRLNLFPSTLCFQSLPHSFAYRAHVFNNLRTLGIMKKRLSPAESIIPALFRKNRIGYASPRLSFAVFASRTLRDRPEHAACEVEYSAPSHVWSDETLARPRAYPSHCNHLAVKREDVPIVRLQIRANRCQNRAFCCNGVQYGAIPCTARSIPTIFTETFRRPRFVIPTGARPVRSERYSARSYVWSDESWLDRSVMQAIVNSSTCQPADDSRFSVPAVTARGLSREGEGARVVGLA
jgi:hypothetical protein